MYIGLINGIFTLCCCWRLNDCWCNFNVISKFHVSDNFTYQNELNWITTDTTTWRYISVIVGREIQTVSLHNVYRSNSLHRKNYDEFSYTFRAVKVDVTIAVGRVSICLFRVVCRKLALGVRMNLPPVFFGYKPSKLTHEHLSRTCCMSPFC